MSFKSFPLASPPPKYLFISRSRLWKVHQVNEEPTDQLPAMNNHGSWVCGQSQSPLFSEGVPDPGYLPPDGIAVRAHKSITLLYFLGSIKTNLSTQTHGVTVFSNPHPNLSWRGDLEQGNLKPPPLLCHPRKTCARCLCHSSFLITDIAIL